MTIGTKKIAPGLYEGMSEQDYFAIDAINNSLLSHMSPTPLHCLEYMQADEDEPTPAKLFGKMLHKAVLELDDFDNFYIQRPADLKKPTPRQIDAANPSASTVKQVRAWNSFLEDVGDRTIITPDDYKAAETIRARFGGSEIAGTLLTDSRKEVVIVWEDPEFGCLMKIRIDILKDAIICDVKTTRNAEYNAFRRDVANYGYHRQHAVYSDGYEAHFGESPEGFIILAVENVPPYACVSYMLDEAGSEIGRAEYRARLKKFLKCREADEWPGYPDEVMDLSLPNWYGA